MKNRVAFSIPEILCSQAANVVAPDAQSRMRSVIQWSRENVARKEGPFAAGVFDLDSGRCLAAGVNRVMSSGCSVAHAEMMALMLAQTNAGCVNLSDKGRFVLTTSAQPCSQCFGAIPWSGVSALEYGATREDVESIGFDEGPYPNNWIEKLEERRIRVYGPLLREDALTVLEQYAGEGGELY